MRLPSPADQQAIHDLTQRHGFSAAAVSHMLEAVIDGGGGMAQFNHAEFGGPGQWMRGGMIMVSDLFNQSLKDRIDRLCNDLAEWTAREPALSRESGLQSQSQGGHPQARVQNAGDSGDWWDVDLGYPTSAGSQNQMRYAYFAQARRLALDLGGQVTLYDTLDHQIGGFSQQQGAGGSLTFSSQHGVVDLASLPVVTANAKPSSATPPAAAPSASPSTARTSGHEGDALAVLERLAELHARGVLSAEEFAAKKAELLKRI